MKEIKIEKNSYDYRFKIADGFKTPPHHSAYCYFCGLLLDYEYTLILNKLKDFMSKEEPKLCCICYRVLREGIKPEQIGGPNDTTLFFKYHPGIVYYSATIDELFLRKLKGKYEKRAIKFINYIKRIGWKGVMIE